MPDRNDRKEPGFRNALSEPAMGDEDPRLARIDSVGTTLRRAREGFGEDLRAVAETLKIRYVYLQAIEDGRYEDLPGATYAVGFIRTYSDYLSLDTKGLVERFKHEVEGLNRRTELVFPTPVPESRVPGGALILISVLLVGIAYGGWLYLSERGDRVVDLVPPVPDRLQALVTPDRDRGGEDRGGEYRLAEAGTGSFSTAGNAADSDPEGLDGSSAEPPVAAPVQEVSELPGRAVTPVTSDAAEELTVASADEASADGASTDGAGTSEAWTPDRATTQAAADAPDTEAPDDGATELAAAGSDGADNSGGETEEVAVPAVPTDETATPEGETAALRDNPAGAAQAATAPASLQPETMGVPAPEGALTLARLIDSQGEAGNGSDETAIPAAPTPEGVPTATPGRTPQVYGQVNEDARIVLRARLDSWVQVRDSSDDSVLIVRVLQEGDSYRVPNREGLTLRTGNAGGLEILIDGRTLGPIGPVGSVRGDIALDPEQLQGGPVAQ